MPTTSKTLTTNEVFRIRGPIERAADLAVREAVATHRIANLVHWLHAQIAKHPDLRRRDIEEIEQRVKHVVCAVIATGVSGHRTDRHPQ